RWVVYLILTIILLIAAFNIIGSLWMLVLEKKKDITYLKSMGAENSLIHKIFLSEGILVALVGASIGAGIALSLILIQQNFGVIPIGGSGTFVVDTYPVEMKITDFLLVFGTVLVISFLAAYFPAKYASRQVVLIKEE
ncbi:MAG: ABC transporter permease, partial [Bacteroidetes bacterium]|nr:ABC transporter permease [Bacteroidota bacterium]